MLDSNEYINECKIEGHGYPISFINLRILDRISENSICKVKGHMFDYKDGVYKSTKESGFFLNKMYQISNFIINIF